MNNYSKIIIQTKWGTFEKPFSWNSKTIWLKTRYNPQGCRKHWSIINFMDILTCKYPSKVYPCTYSEVINECYIKVMCLQQIWPWEVHKYCCELFLMFFSLLHIKLMNYFSCSFFSGGRLEGSKHNLKFQSTTWPQTPSQ